MSFTNTLTRYDAELVDLLARRPELRDVGIAGFPAAVDGAPGKPTTPVSREVGLAIWRWAA